jgi:hypothetical protein
MGATKYRSRSSSLLRTDGTNDLSTTSIRFNLYLYRYHVCIVHTYQWWMLGTSTVQIYINGMLVEHGGLKYPNTNQVMFIPFHTPSPSPLFFAFMPFSLYLFFLVCSTDFYTNQTYTMCFLGTSLSMDTAFMYIPKECTLCGTIGPTMLFSGAITQNQVRVLSFFPSVAFLHVHFLPLYRTSL